MRVLDLFCGAGGASVGYSIAGHDVTGVDIVQQKNYPFQFICKDALSLDYETLLDFDFIHASPPCQAYATAGNRWHKSGKVYPDLIRQTRAMLIASGKPYVIENVMGAPLKSAVRLCGSMFGLGVIRHRLFETSFPITEKMTCNHHGSIANGDYVTVAGNGGKGNTLRKWQSAMEINWMDKRELAQSVPPAYTHWLVQQYETQRLIDEVQELTMDKPVQLNMFDGIETDWGKQDDKPHKGRWYIVTRNWSREALYLIDGKWCWCEYDPLVSVPHATTSHIEAKRLRVQQNGHDIRIWPYGVLRPGRTK